VKSASIAGIVCLIASAVAVAQQPSPGHLMVPVQDSTGVVTSGAEVQVLSPDNYVQTAGRTTAEGIAKFDLVPGSYELRILQKGFKQLLVPRLEIAEGQNQSIKGRLTPGDPPCSMPCQWIWYADIPTQPIEISQAIPKIPIPQLARPSHRRHFL
jgi:hypothetical protein